VQDHVLKKGGADEDRAVLNNERIARLEGLGFQWYTAPEETPELNSDRFKRLDEFDTMLERLKAYKQQHGVSAFS